MNQIHSSNLRKKSQWNSEWTGWHCKAGKAALQTEIQDDSRIFSRMKARIEVFCQLISEFTDGRDFEAE